MTPEGYVKKAVKAELDVYPDHYREMPVPGGFGKSGLDFTICFFGFFLAIETKKPKGTPTPRQEERIREIAAAGGFTLVIDTVEQCKGELREFLARVAEHASSPDQREIQAHRRALLPDRGRVEDPHAI